MRKLFTSAVITATFLALSATAADPSPSIGAANFATCITESKFGKKEQENMEGMRKQMSSMIEDTEKELREIATKFEDTEYLDSLSPKAEEELKAKFETLQQDLSRYQNQFYQVLNHAQYQMVQKVSNNISKAAEKVAAEKHLDYVLNKEACFYIRPDLDVTTMIISEMDKNFELDTKSDRFSENGEFNASEETAVEHAG